MAANISLPWTLARDFNCILNNNDRVTNNNHLNADLDFQHFIHRTGLCEVNYIGNFYPWRGGNTFSTHSRLDRVLANFDLLNKCPHMTVAVHNHSTSNHSPLLISFINNSPQRSIKPSKFNNARPALSRYHSIIDSCFNIRIQESPAFWIIKRLKMIKGSLNEWNRSKQSIRQRCDNFRENNNSIYLQLIDNRHNEFLLRSAIL